MNFTKILLLIAWLFKSTFTLITLAKLLLANIVQSANLSLPIPKPSIGSLANLSTIINATIDNKNVLYLLLIFPNSSLVLFNNKL